ncbi:hypothetical protein [Roseomonas sp. BN140053]|uniref:hypothetical protein n=1 Tax=Roseomonas sp. BN140053 TaxID=3391898 RepID=UPI0039ECAF15
MIDAEGMVAVAQAGMGLVAMVVVRDVVQARDVVEVEAMDGINLITATWGRLSTQVESRGR